MSDLKATGTKRSRQSIRRFLKNLIQRTERPPVTGKYEVLEELGQLSRQDLESLERKFDMNLKMHW